MADGRASAAGRPPAAGGPAKVDQMDKTAEATIVGGESGVSVRAVGADLPNRAVPGPLGLAVATACALFAAWHLYVLNIAPLETWTFRILHVAGALALAFVLTAPTLGTRRTPSSIVEKGIGLLALAVLVAATALVGTAYALLSGGTRIADLPAWMLGWFGPLLGAGSAIAILAGWAFPARQGEIRLVDWALALASIAVCVFFLLGLQYMALRLKAGTPFADPANAWAAAVGVALILEATRRLAGLALVVIAGIFVLYAFVGPWLPGFLTHAGYTASRFFTYIYTDNGILGPTTAVSSTYIILFIIFGAFLQETRVGQYFVDFSFAIAGRSRGGPAKVAVFASGLMGTINGTSAGNVVATGSMTIPLMKSVGYRPKTAGAIEAAASTGGQIMPPIMGAGAFIMAEITGVPYTEIAVAAIIPSVLYFVAVYMMVDLEALRTGMKGMRQEDLPSFARLVRQAYLFAPMAILVFALFSGYSVLRAGTLAIAAAAVVSWLTPWRMGPRRLFDALALASAMALQIIAVCAAAGIIVGVIALTGVGARFSSLLLDLAAANILLALVFAMAIAIVLGMGMPTTAAYAVAASVVAPGLVQLGVEPLVAHFFVFFFAVISAITPPVALAAYAGAAIAGADPMRTSVESFRFGLTAFIVPFMFFYNTALLMQGDPFVIGRALLTAIVGVWLLSQAVQGWFMGRIGLVPRLLLFVAALAMIEGGLVTDLVGIGLLGATFLLVRLTRRQAAPAG